MNAADMQNVIARTLQACGHVCEQNMDKRGDMEHYGTACTPRGPW